MAGFEDLDLRSLPKRGMDERQLSFFTETRTWQQVLEQDGDKESINFN
jgi:hypothetical protein